MNSTEKTRHETFSISSSVFKKLHWIYLIAYAFAQASDSLPSVYRYAMLSSYYLSRSTIERISVISHLSWILIGTFSISLSDHYGRRFICLVSIFCNILSNFTFVSVPMLWLLIIGYISMGIEIAAHSSTFEAWLLQECEERQLDMLSLRRILRNSYFIFCFVAIFTGFSSQFLVEFGGYACPFIISIVLCVITLLFIWEFWTENYGSQHTTCIASFRTAFRVIQTDPRAVLLGMSSNLFEVVLQIYTIEWTPTLQQTSPESLPIGLGSIFALMWISELIGVCLFEPLSKYIREQTYMIVVYLLAAIVVSIPVIVPNSFIGILAGFLVFKTCMGIFRPSMGVLRNFYYPNEVRVTIISFMRVPSLIFLLIVLLGHFQLRTIWIICVCFIIIAMLCMIILRNLKMPEEKVNMDEMDILIKTNQSELPKPQRK